MKIKRFSKSKLEKRKTKMKRKSGRDKKCLGMKRRESGLNYPLRKVLFDIRYEGSDIYVPIRDSEGILWSLLKISLAGDKFFHPGSCVAWGFHIIGKSGSTVYL